MDVGINNVASLFIANIHYTFFNSCTNSHTTITRLNATLSERCFSITRNENY